MSKKILLVEDDESLGFITKDNLENHGYEVSLCVNGEEGVQAFSRQKYDLYLLDVMLPKLDGFSLAAIIRAKDTITPIIFLTAKGLQEDKLAGFKVGGDDYITKPFSMEELIYRIESCLKRRGAFDSPTAQWTLGSFVLDTVNLKLIHDKSERKLTRRESEIIHYLLVRKGTIVPREEILLALWGENDYFKGRSLDVFISKIRKYLKPDSNLDIENHHAVGFRLIEKNTAI